MTRTGLSTLVILMLAAVVYIGCNNGNSVVTPPPGSITKFVSADVCTTCHARVGGEWEHTAHYYGLEDLMTSDHWAEHCFACHTTGYDDDPANSGYDDPNPAVAAKFAGIQCEACHGPGSDHIATFAPMDRIDAINPDKCGVCHEGSRHGVIGEWTESAHANALSNPIANSSHFSLHCLECHSTDYRMADVITEDMTPEDFKYGIVCADCHDPHAEHNPGQLRKPVGELCGECHTASGAVPGDSPHHPHGDVLLGTGGYEYPGGTYENSAHSYLADGCAACHMWTSPYNATGEGEDAVLGHLWHPTVEGCQQCHTSADSFDIYGAQSEITSLMEELAAELDAATENDMLTLAYERAAFNLHFVEVDGSLGIHNLPYCRALLEDAIANFEPGS